MVDFTLKDDYFEIRQDGHGVHVICKDGNNMIQQVGSTEYVCPVCHRKVRVCHVKDRIYQHDINMKR